MLDYFLNKVCGKEYHILALIIMGNILYAVPCEDTMSGYYPVYNKKVQLSDFQITEFMNCKIDNEDIDAILLRIYKNELEIIPCYDSWDGFQPLNN